MHALHYKGANVTYFVFLEDKNMYNEEGGRTILTGRYDGCWVSQPARHLTNFKSHFRTTERFMALF